MTSLRGDKGSGGGRREQFLLSGVYIAAPANISPSLFLLGENIAQGPHNKRCRQTFSGGWEVFYFLFLGTESVDCVHCWCGRQTPLLVFPMAAIKDSRVVKPPCYYRHRKMFCFCFLASFLTRSPVFACPAGLFPVSPHSPLF